MRKPNLLAWQWSAYAAGHRDRRNLLSHVITVPFFMSGTIALITAPLVRGWTQGLAGLVTMVLVMGAQGRSHRLEQRPPDRFEGPLDVLGRIFFEQWITFPRYVLSGGFREAWRNAAR